MKYSKRAFHFSVFSAVLLVIFLILSSVSRTSSNTSMNDVTGYLMTLFFVTVTGGFVLSLLGIREKTSSKKVIALVFNVAMFLWLGYYVLQNAAGVKEVFK